ncbi:hypothetical protein INR49_014365 [Caranx melampygus]|nr:hypothetical protein INR49_014365 [Caranx melampygus]
MMHTMWIVVAPGGVTALAQVSVLMDVHRSGLWITVRREATEPEQDFETSMRMILLEQDLTVHSGQALSYPVGGGE